MDLTTATLRPSPLFTLPALLALSACAGEPSHAGDDAAPAAPLGQQALAVDAKTLNASEMQALNDAEGTFFAAVRAEGAGCPEGTLNTRVSPDGQAFTTTFSAFELKIDAAGDAMTRDCRFVVMLDSPGGRSFCVKQFGYSGNAFLEQGVSGRHVAEYSFNEQKLAVESSRKDFVGPFDDDFVFTDTVQEPEEVWTPCGEQRDLIVDTKLELTNGSPHGAGLINVSAADGQNAVQITLASHRCDMAKNDGWTVGPFAGREDKLTTTGDVAEPPPEATPDVPDDTVVTTPSNTGTSNTGNRGNTGTVGNTGNRGNTGTVGNTGNRGNTGTVGNNGNRGNTGTNNTGNRGNTGGRTGSTGGSTSTGGRTGNTGGSRTGDGPSIGSVGRTVR